MYYLGIDIGSLTCDAVIIDDAETILASAVIPTGARNKESIARVKAEVLERVKIQETDLAATISTGYGRDRVDNRLAAVTEITCHARGIRFAIPATQVLIDIGGQDSKAIRLDGDGRVIDFAMNDKCAAGTGRFLEAMARALQVDIEELGALDQGAQGTATLSSMCTVFAESEVVSLIANGVEIKEIVRGLNKAIASRTLGLVKRVAGDAATMTVAMSGGVARNAGVVRALGAAMGCDILVPNQPDSIGALGAALIAQERYEKSNTQR